MTQQDWKALLTNLKIITNGDKVTPVDYKILDTFEKDQGVKLPSSYRTYCHMFGAGQIANLFNIAVPGYSGQTPPYSTEYLSKSQIDLADQYAELGVDSTQLKRSIFFCFDIIGSNHFFDPEDVIDNKNSEYAVFTLFRSGEIQRSANDFWEFITVFCLGDKCNKLIIDVDSPDQVFRPMSH